MQLPPEQIWLAPHRRRHAPQLAVSVRRSTSHPLRVWPSQSAKPGGQVQRPEMQSSPAAQVTEHPPQLSASLIVLTSHPFDGLPSHSANPGRHTLEHCPATHVVPGQEWVHVPQ